MTHFPSGEQFEIAAADYRGVITEVGAGLRVLSHRDVPLIDGYSREERCSGGRGQLLVPWPNRIADAEYFFDGVNYQLAVTEASTGCAIHGLTRWIPWRLDHHDATSLRLTTTLFPQPGWPGIVDLTVTYRVDESGLAVRLTAHNKSPESIPFGAGFHPYVLAGDDKIDYWTLQLPAETVVLCNDRGIPAERRSTSNSPYDFQDGNIIGDTQIDNPFTDLVRDEDGRAVVRVITPAREVTLWLDDSYRWLQVFTGDQLDEVARRRRSLAIEPMTCPPNAFQTGEDLIVLQPDETWSSTWGLQATEREL